MSTEQCSNEDFDEAAAKVKTLKTSPTNDELLTLYALYKQSTCGDNTTCRPGTFDFKGKKKWAAWNGKKGSHLILSSSKIAVFLPGLSPEDAKQQYVELAKGLVGKYGTC